MGAVYEALDERLNRRVAVKFLRGDYSTDRRMLRRFEQEARAACSVRSDHIIDITDVGESADGSPYLVMDLLDGSDLRAVLRSQRRLSVPRAAALCVQICRGLATVHARGIVHRDLKPENLFVTPHGDGAEHVTILDFGVAKLVEAEALSCATMTGSVLGTPCYMAPEQVRGVRIVDHRTDLYAVGVILYECLGGSTPLAGERSAVMYQIVHEPAPPLEDLRPELPATLVGLIARAMAKDPADRPGSATELALALGPFTQSGELAVRRQPELAPGVTITSAGTHAAPPPRSERGNTSNPGAQESWRERTGPGLAATTLGLRRPRSVAVGAGAGLVALVAGVYFWPTLATPTTSPRSAAESIPRAVRVEPVAQATLRGEPASPRGAQPGKGPLPTASASSEASQMPAPSGNGAVSTPAPRGALLGGTRPTSRSPVPGGRTAAKSPSGEADALPFDRENPY